MTPETEARIVAVLIEIRDELKSWRVPESTGCAHPEEQLMDLSDMREIHYRCKACKQEWRRDKPCRPTE